MSIFCTFTTTPLIALLCSNNNSQLQLQSSCRKDESSIFKKDTNYVHWMYEVHWPSVPVSGGGGAELTETSLHSPVTASVDPALESLSGRRLLRAAPRCKHKREFYKCVSG